KGPVLLLDAGDIFTRGPGRSLEGKPDIALMNLMGYDAAAIGNNEFKGDEYKGSPTPRSMEILAERQKEAAFPFLCANVYKDGKRAFTPYIIKEAQGLKIGIFGVTAPTSRSYGSTKGYTFTEAVDEAEKVIAELRPAADIIICLSHAGVIDDIVMANRYKDIDLIVGGHTHTWLHTPLFSSAGKPVKDKNVNGVIVCSAGEYGVAVGRIDLRLALQDDGSWAVSRYTSRLVPMTGEYKDDPEAAALLKKYWQPLGLVK
ncbi:MAG: metallophosphatase, partial [Abditibacteriota bacterium]|nr:metallophosphatase [Abditibacteriota bacterium]